MRQKPLAALAVAAVLTVFSGCAGPAVFLSKNFTRAGKIALLPIANNSNDLDAPAFIRLLLFSGLSVRGYQVLPPGPIDDALKAQGFTDGGQLGAASSQQLGQWTGGDLLFYTVIESFDYINVGFYWQRRVTIHGKLVNALTGEKLWEADRTYSTRWVVASEKEAERQFAIQLAAKAVEKMTHRPLQKESEITVNLLLQTLPH